MLRWEIAAVGEGATQNIDATRTPRLRWRLTGAVTMGTMAADEALSGPAGTVPKGRSVSESKAKSAGGVASAASSGPKTLRTTEWRSLY